MVKFDTLSKYLEIRRGKEYWVNLVVEEAGRTPFIIMSIKHHFAGRHDDGIFLIQFLNELSDFHHTVHSDGTRHTKIRRSGTKKEEKITLPLPKLPPLTEIKKPTQLWSGCINLHDVQEYYGKTAQDISRFCRHPDQIITLNRKHTKLDQISISVSIVPKGKPYFVSSNKFLNPSVYLFNILEPQLVLEVGYEIMPLARKESEPKIRKEINIVSQISSMDKIWIDFTPSLLPDRTKLEIPEWIFICKNKEYKMPPVTIDLKEGCRLIIGAFNGVDHYYYDTIGAHIEPFDRDGPIMPTIVWVENGIVNILKNIHA